MDAYGWELDYADEIVLFDLIFDTGRGARRRFWGY